MYNTYVGQASRTLAKNFACTSQKHLVKYGVNAIILRRLDRTGGDMKGNEEFSVAMHFEGKAVSVRGIYDRVLDALKRNGPIIEEAKKTSIHLVNVTAAAGVATRKDSLILTIKGDKELKSKRIKKSERVSANRYHHEIKLEIPDEVDEEIADWLKAAYKISG